MAARRRKRRKIEDNETGVPFACGFHRPTPKQSRKAIGLFPIPTNFEPGPESLHFREIPSPKCKDDWLAQYKEEGQSFKCFLKTNPWISGRRVKHTKQKFIPDGKDLKERYPDGKIYVQPLGDFYHSSNSDCSPCLSDLADYTERFYALPVVVLPEMKLKIPKKKGNCARGLIFTGGWDQIAGCKLKHIMCVRCLWIENFHVQRIISHK